MRRFRDYYRQFEELTPEEVSRQLRERRDAERARALAEVPPLDLATAAWHEPPHPEIVNAATFALRRALNAYPDPSATALRRALGELHGVDPERIVVGHGAGESLRAALRAILAGGGDTLVPWPAWGRLPQLVAEAGGRAVPVPLGDDGVPALPAPLPDGVRAVVVCRPNDPTGGVLPLAAVRELAAALPEHAWLMLDEALAGFLPVGEDAVVDHPRVVSVRSFSKAHAMAGLRVGYAIVPDGDARLADGLAPLLGASAPAQAGALWAAESGAAVVARRRARAARERERLAAALAGGPAAFAPGHGPLVWLSAGGAGGRELAGHLAARRIFVTPGSAWGDDRHVRVALRDAAGTDRLAAALGELPAP